MVAGPFASRLPLVGALMDNGKNYLDLPDVVDGTGAPGWRHAPGAVHARETVVHEVPDDGMAKVLEVL